MITQIGEAHQFLCKFSNTEAPITSGQCLCLLFAEVRNGRTALGIKSCFSWMLHYYQSTTCPVHNTVMRTTFTATVALYTVVEVE